MARSKSYDSSGKVPKSTPDWTTPGGITTPRVDTLGPQSPDDWKVGESIPPEVPSEDRGKREESEAMGAIWKSYEAGY